KKRDRLEILSPRGGLNRSFVVDRMYDADGTPVDDAKLVQQILRIDTGGEKLFSGDMLRKMKECRKQGES
ncbi:MAG: U32 family peptidase C-terminal domain-containing protein, partial [Firmicutes bacterium]|nr:U32 family peptidase C-terminal domain-containing protein [Bacillota bacterium]